MFIWQKFQDKAGSRHIFALCLILIPFGFPGSFPEMGFLVWWPLRCWMRGFRGEIWRIVFKCASGCQGWVTLLGCGVWSSSLPYQSKVWPASTFTPEIFQASNSSSLSHWNCWIQLCWQKWLLLIWSWSLAVQNHKLHFPSQLGTIDIFQYGHKYLGGKLFLGTCDVLWSEWKSVFWS